MQMNQHFVLSVILIKRSFAFNESSAPGRTTRARWKIEQTACTPKHTITDKV